MPNTDSFRCPTCNARQAPSPECRRCKCDLSLLVAAWQQCDQLHEDCLRSLAARDVEAAEALALQRWELSPDEEAARLLATSYLLQGRYQAAIDISQIPNASSR